MIWQAVLIVLGGQLSEGAWEMSVRLCITWCGQYCIAQSEPKQHTLHPPKNSMKLPGHPCIHNSGTASLFLLNSATKWMPNLKPSSSISTR